MSRDPVQIMVEEATLDFTLGDNETALEKLREAVRLDGQSFAAWHAMAEVCFSLRLLDEALEAAEKALAICPHDIHIHTSLSRIWMERGDKENAEKFGAKARTLSWKDELKSPPPAEKENP